MMEIFKLTAQKKYFYVPQRLCWCDKCFESFMRGHEFITITYEDKNNEE